MSRTLINTGAIVTMNAEGRFIRGGAIVLNDSLIESVLTEDQVPQRGPSETEIVDAAALVAVPGFVQTHLQKLQTSLKSCYNPEGYNLGMNLGKCAGAGVADHLHLHLLPRWTGDSSFMTVVGETRVQPEDLLTTYDKLAAFFPRTR